MKFCQKMDVDNPNVDLEDQGHRSKVKVTRSKKTWFQVSFDRPKGNLWGQGSHRSNVTWVKVKGRLWRLRSRVKVTRSKMWFQVSFDHLAGTVRGQRSYGSESKFKWDKPSLKIVILAAGLTSMSSCFIIIDRQAFKLHLYCALCFCDRLLCSIFFTIFHSYLHISGICMSVYTTGLSRCYLERTASC